MTKKNEKKKKVIPVQNYIIAIVIVLLVIGLTFYIFKWVNVVQEDRLSTSYLVKSNAIINEVKTIEEITSVFSEVPSEYYIYVSYNNDNDIYEMEKDLAATIKEYGLKDNFYYINATEIMKKDDYINKLNDALKLEGDKRFNKIPVIIMYRDGKIVEDGVVIREDSSIIKASDFVKLLEIYEIEKMK